MPKLSPRFFVDTEVSGIPCQAAVTTYDNDYGLIDLEWQIADRKGYSAQWLEKKLTKSDRTRIDHEIIECCSKRNDYDY